MDHDVFFLPRGRLIRMMLVLLLASSGASAWADLFSPNRPLRVISTEWFDIHYPEDAQESAQALALRADEEYVRIAALFGTEPRLRFPVVLTPDPESINGYYTVWPSRRLVLYLAPTDPNEELGFQSEDLLAVFRHELAHAVSLTLRPPFWDGVAAVFGDPAGISYYTTPGNLAEGAAVAAEGMDGYGRSEDPLAQAEVRQDILEGRFKSFWESAGAWDRYPYGRVPYSYGAQFTRYLRGVYGDDLYRELWRRLGEGVILPGLGDAWFVRGVFHDVYGIPLDRAWEDFGAWMAPVGPVRDAQVLGKTGYLTALAGADKVVYWADSAARRIRSLDVESGSQARSYDGDASITRLDAAPDGSRLLVSYLRYEGDFPKLALRELSLSDGRYRDLPYRGLRDAAYSSDGIVAIRAEPGAASLVLARDGSVETLLAGSVSVSYASPAGSPDGRWVYALRRENGQVSVIRVELAAPQESSTPAPVLGAFEGTTPAEALGAGASFPARRVQRLILPPTLASIRYLSVGADGAPRFSWDNGSFYSLAEVEGDMVRFQRVPLSGGVHKPVFADGGVYYLGFFSEGSAVCAFPSDRSPLDMDQAPVFWEDLVETQAAPPETRPPGSDDPGAASLDAQAGEADPDREESGLFPSRPYSVLPWLFPRFRYPAFSLSSEGLWSVGVGTVSADPVESFTLTLDAQWIPLLNAANLNASLELSVFDPTLLLQASDEFSLNEDDSVARSTLLALSAARSFALYGGRSLGARVAAGVQGFSAISPGADPYGSYQAALATGILFLSYGRWAYDTNRPGAQRGAQVDLEGFAARPLPPDDPEFLGGLEAALFLRALPAAFALDLYGALSLSPSLEYGPGGRSFSGYRSGALYPSYPSFENEDPGAFYVYADFSIAPAVLEIMRGLGPVYLRRLIPRAGARAAGTDRAFFYSGYARLTLDFAPLMGILAELRPVAWIEADFAPAPGVWTIQYLVELPM